MKRIDWYKTGLFLFIAAAGSIIYGITAAPTVTFEDSGEFITAAHILGIAHPSAYPIYLLICKIFTFLPFYEIAWRVNIASSLFVVLSGLILFDTLINISNKKTYFISSALSILLFLSQEIWKQGVIAEVYSLNLLFFALILRIQLSELPLLKKIYLNSLAVGLGLCNHLTLVFVVPFLIIDIIWRYKKNVFDKMVLLVIIFFIIGISAYLYLPIRSKANPYLDWGNPKSISEISDVITQKEFSVVRSGGELSSFRVKLKYCYNNLNASLPSCFWQVFGISGILLVFLFKQIRTGFLLLCLILFYTIFVCKMYNVEENILYSINVFFIPAHYSILLATGYGYIRLIERLKDKGVIMEKILGGFLLIFYGYLFFSKNYETNNKRNYTHAKDWAINVLNCVGDNGLLLMRIDNDAFPLFYLNKVLKYRTDVELVNVIFVERLWYRNDLRQRFINYDLTEPVDTGNFAVTKRFIFSFVEQAKQERPVYFLNIPENISDPWTKENFAFLEHSKFSLPHQYIKNLDLFHPCIPEKFDKLDREVI
ncbi:MAG: DUF2723 domain-containing protein, partial [Candidatus Hydrogenedentota bacterium]